MPSEFQDPTSTTQKAVTAGGSSTSSSYGYDAWGNTTIRPGHKVTYDATGKPATVVAGSSEPKSRVPRSAQKREGVAMGAS